MKITIEFDDQDQRAIYDGTNYRAEAIEEVIDWLQGHKQSLPLTITAHQKIGKCTVIVEREANGL